MVQYVYKIKINVWNCPSAYLWEAVDIVCCICSYLICVDYLPIYRLMHVPKPKMKVCILGDQLHMDQAKANDLPCMDTEALKKLNKDKKLVKKLGITLYSFAFYVIRAVDMFDIGAKPTLVRAYIIPISLGYGVSLQNILKTNIFQKLEYEYSNFKSN